MCMVCKAVATGETNPDHRTILQVLAFLDSDFTSLANTLERLCKDHRRLVRAAIARHNAEWSKQSGGKARSITKGQRIEGAARALVLAVEEGKEDLHWSHAAVGHLRAALTSCDRCDEPSVQVVADTTKEPVEYRYRCWAHMNPDGPFPADQQQRLD